jgi:hypothetical protein
MAVKQEHLMAYDPLHRQLRNAFHGDGGGILQETLRKAHSEAAVKYVDRFISELALPPAGEDYATLNKISRLIRGSYAASVLGYRVSSILKQLIESPAPFFQYVTPLEYAGAAISCLRPEERAAIFERSVYLKTRYRDPSMAVIHEMERMALAGRLGKIESGIAKVSSFGMKGLEWADAVAVMPGWLAAYRKRLAELNRGMERSGGVQEEIQLGAKLIAMAERAWNGDKTPARVDFAASERLQAEIQKETGQDLQTIVITNSDIEHIKKQHGQDEWMRGQIDITPEDIAFIPFIMNEFDTAKYEGDSARGKRHSFTKQINGTAYVISIEQGEHKQRLVSFWKKKSQGPHANALGRTSETIPASHSTIQRANDLRNSKELVERAGMTVEQAEAEAIRYADQVVRDCQPDADPMSQIPLLNQMNRHPLGRIFALFQTPMAVIFQNLFVDAPNHFRHGRILQGLWTFAIYGFVAALIGAMKEEDDGEEWNPKNRAIDALGGWLGSTPVIGGEIAFVTESLLRDGKIRYRPSNSLSPVWNSTERAINALSAEKWGKALDMTVDAFGYSAGLPVGLKHEAQKAVEDEDWEILLGIK